MSVDDNTDIYIVQEKYGIDLATIIHGKDNCILTEEHIRVITYNLICAIKYIHSGTIVHRDIKPSNILIDSNGGVKLCDYGLARTIAQPSADMSSAKEETPKTPRIGTSSYMAPETILCSKN